MNSPIILQIENAHQRLGVIPALGGSAAGWEFRH